MTIIYALMIVIGMLLTSIAAGSIVEWLLRDKRQ